MLENAPAQKTEEHTAEHQTATGSQASAARVQVARQRDKAFYNLPYFLLLNKMPGKQGIKCHKFDPKRYKFKLKKPLPPIQICDVPHLEGAPAQVVIATDKRTNKIVKARIEIPPNEMYASKKAKKRAVAHEIGHIIAKNLSAGDKKKYASTSGEDEFDEEAFAGDVATIATGGTYSGIGGPELEQRIKKSIDWMRTNIVQSDLPVNIRLTSKSKKRDIKY